MNLKLCIVVCLVLVMLSKDVESRARQKPTATTTKSTTIKTTTEVEDIEDTTTKVDDENDDDDDDDDNKSDDEDEQKVTSTKKPTKKTTAKSSSSSTQTSLTLPQSDTVAPNSTDNDEKCSTPSIHDFPPDIFTQTQRRFGGMLFHCAFAIYLFFSLLKVCDDYFMPALEIIGEKLNLDQDVAGATFMAAGSSAPEVFISLIGIFVNESSAGIGSIVGSAVFNILFVVGICGLFVSGVARLTIWPFLRDSVFYCVAILMLLLLVRDEKVYWYESVILLILYGGYLFLMMNNDRLKNLVYQKFAILQQENKEMGLDGSGPSHNKAYGFTSRLRSSNPPSRSQSGYNRFNDEEDAWGATQDNYDFNSNQHNAPTSYQNSVPMRASNKSNKVTSHNGIDQNMLLNADSLVASNTRQIDFHTAVYITMYHNKRWFKPITRFRMAVRRVMDEIVWLKRTSNSNSYTPNLNNFDLNPLNKANYSLFFWDKPDINQPNGMMLTFKWICLLPTKILFYFTMPDVRVEKYKKWFVVTFCLSILWLAVLSYLLIWMITVIGFTLGIPDSLMAVTFIAAGTSIPDAYTSVIVVREGMVDMGVSNIIGSNVFDLLIGLAFPWFIKAIFNGGYVTINSNGLGYDSILLFACVFVTILVIHFKRWNLDRQSGYVFMSIYAAFLIISASIELNVFSFVNPPMCS